MCEKSGVVPNFRRHGRVGLATDPDLLQEIAVVARGALVDLRPEAQHGFVILVAAVVLLAASLRTPSSFLSVRLFWFR